MFIRAAAVLASVAIIALALSGPGTRWGWWDFRIGLLLFAAAGLVGLLAAVTGIVARRRAPAGSQSARLADLAIFAGVVSLALPLYGVVSARRVPRIHDITTSIDDPPRFRAALAARGNHSNPVADA